MAPRKERGINMNIYGNKYGPSAAATSTLWMLGMVHLWPVLQAAHGLCTACVCGPYMAYVWVTYGLCFNWPSVHILQVLYNYQYMFFEAAHVCLQLNHLVPQCWQIALEALGSQKKAKGSSDAAHKCDSTSCQNGASWQPNEPNQRDDKFRLDEMSTRSFQKTQAYWYEYIQIDTANRYE